MELIDAIYSAMLKLMWAGIACFFIKDIDNPLVLLGLLVLTLWALARQLMPTVLTLLM